MKNEKKPGRAKPHRFDALIAAAEAAIAAVDALPPPQITWTARVPTGGGAPYEPGGSWIVAAEPWLVSDGMYGELYRGRRIDFALRCRPLSLARVGAVERPRALALGHGVYRVDARVVHRADDVCVLDFGLLAYAAEVPEWASPGTAVSGEVELGLDDGSYLEGMYADVGLPAMLYPWRIDGIVVEHAARIPASEADRERYGSPDLMTNHPGLRALTELRRVDWEADRRPGEMARYYFECGLLSRIPRHPGRDDGRSAHAARNDA